VFQKKDNQTEDFREETVLLDRKVFGGRKNITLTVPIIVIPFLVVFSCLRRKDLLNDFSELFQNLT